MTDIVERLRGPDGYALAIKEMREDAAAEIKRLRARVAKLEGRLEDAVAAYDAEVFMRLADVHDIGCKCLRCAIDHARAALGEKWI